MATINLGRVKPVFRGAYAGGTAYVVDDIVTDGGETFICILASTGNATSNTTYWSKLASKGTDGTDIGTTLTTQGDILYRDGSGLQRLAAGTANQVLQTGGAGANPSWGTVSSDFVKLAETTITGSSTTAINFDQAISSTYKFYKLYGVYKIAGSNPYLTMRWREGSSSSETTYANSTYRYINDAFHDSAASSRGNGQDSGVSYFQMDNDSGDAKWNNIEIMFNIATAGSAIEYPSWNGTSWQWRDSNTTFFVNTLGGFTDATITPTGFHFYSTNGSNFVANTTFKLFGVK